MEDRKWQICLQKLHCSLAVLLLLNFSPVVATTELLVEVPKSLTIAVNSSAIFTCRSIANTEISWSITGKKFSPLGFSDDGHIDVLESLGITLLESNQSNVSIVRVEGIPDNNGTKLVCTAIRMLDATIDQSDEALLILYGPPNPPTDIRISAPSSFMLQLNWNEPVFAFESVPFTYTLFIQNENGFFASDIQLEQNETEYLFVANESDGCQNFSFVLRSMNDAGYGNESETITSAVPNVPGQVSNVHTRVYFTEDGDAELLLRFPAPEVCQCYPILLYSVKLTDITNCINEQNSLEINETFDNLNSTNDDGFVELIVSGQLISDRRYMVSVSAENEVGRQPDLESKDIYTTDLQDVNVTLIENNLTIVCVFAEGSNSRGCLVRLTNFNQTFPILRNSTQDLVSSVIPINGLQLPDSTNLEILVSDYESDGSYGNLSWNITVSWNITLSVTIPTSTTQTPETINIQDISIKNSNDCRLMTTCHFAVGSSVDGCMVSFYKHSIGYESDPVYQILIPHNGSLISTAVIERPEYFLFKGNMSYIAKGSGTVNGIVVDEFEATVEFVLPKFNENDCPLVTVDNNSSFELSRELMIAIIVSSAVLVVTCSITICSVCIVKGRKDKGRRSVRKKNAMIKHGIPLRPVQPEPPEYIEILADPKAPHKPIPRSHQERITYRGDISMSETIRKPKAAETLMSDAKPVLPPRLLRQNSIKEEEVYSQITGEIPLKADELHEIPQLREEEEEGEYIEITNETQDIQVNWNSAYNKLEMYNIV